MESKLTVADYETQPQPQSASCCAGTFPPRKTYVSLMKNILFLQDTNKKIIQYFICRNSDLNLQLLTGPATYNAGVGTHSEVMVRE